MRLELASFAVNDMAWGKATAYGSGVLSLDKGELLSWVKQDPRIATADLEIVRPGDRVRLVGVRDAVEPRVKAKGPGGVFPGILGPLHGAGEGITNRLSGMAVVASARYTASTRSGAGASTASTLDMWGLGAAVTPFGTTRNLVLLLEIADGLPEFDVHLAIQNAELRLAERLARTTLGLKPDHSEIFELPPVSSELPRVAYILGFPSTPWNPHPGVSLYGLPVKESLPTVLHPNELFDGAVTPDTRRGKALIPHTWEWQNQPVVLGLYREHGRRLNFLGVVFQRIHYQTYMGKEIGAMRTAQLARAMGAQAAIITRQNVSGNMLMDSVLTVQACERAGIRSIFVTPEYGGKSGDELPLLFTVPEADAIVSTGGLERKIEFDAPDRVLGPGGVTTLLDLDWTSGVQSRGAGGRFSPEGWDAVIGGIDWWGGGRRRCEDY